MCVRWIATWLFVIFAFAWAGPVSAAEGLVVKSSTYGVAETVDRLETALGEKGITVLARVDHAANAASAGMDLPPTELLIFGNPKLGTPLMQSEREVGIDLPMKALVWEDEDGDVFLAYNEPAWFARRHGIGDRGQVIEKMAGALDALTDAAVADAH